MNLEQRLQKYRLSATEYELIKKKLGREPQGVEWAVFSALWSEHCSYKSSKIHLRKFAKTTKRVVAAMGENAGVVDLGEGERIAFKMESHNHPSYIEPYQGAATGVGGILRDIFTMGARPIALANYLCFGNPSYPRMKKLVDGVVRGIAGYGNCVGVPMVAGQTEFDDSYNQNILVNALAVGYLGPKDAMASAKSSQVGAKVVYVGAKTGRDGIHGASMASQSFDEKSAGQRPTVQIGDPFYEKLLIESCIEVIQQDLVIAIQDMGAAGLTSSSFEMAAGGNVGFDLKLDSVPLRDQTLTPEDILLSESQERMLLICDEKKFPAIEKIFKNWDLDAAIIGEVIAENVVRLRWHNEVIAEINPKTVVENAPVYDRPYDAWTPQNRVASEEALDPKHLENFKNLNVNMAAKTFIFDQYDQRVGAATAMDCSTPIGAVQLPSGRALGLALGCRPQVMKWDAREGALDAIALPSIKLAAYGFRPQAVTDCLNFGNPERREIMSEFVASVDAMTEICEVLDIPVVSGNVSFYNQTSGKDITSTPAIGIIGLKQSVEVIPSAKLLKPNLKVICVSMAESGCVDGLGYGAIKPNRVKDLMDALLTAFDEKLTTSIQVAGENGVAWTLANMLGPKIGLKFEATRFTRQICRFYDVIIGVEEKNVASLMKVIKQYHLEHHDLGVTDSSGDLTIKDLNVSHSQLNDLRQNAWRDNFGSL